MTNPNRALLLILALTFAACGVDAMPMPPIPGGIACTQQAETWCNRVPYHAYGGMVGSGCFYNYATVCSILLQVDPEQQTDCLDAMSAVATDVPAVCLAIWR